MLLMNQMSKHIHCKKGYRFSLPQSPRQMSLTKLSLAGNNFLLGTEKSITFFSVYNVYLAISFGQSLYSILYLLAKEGTEETEK
jgi:hypothetical protein